MSRLEGKRVLITQVDDYMGPAIRDLFTAEAAAVQTWDGAVPNGDALSNACNQVGEIDVLVANLAHDPCNTPVAEIADDNWYSLFDALVHPLMRLVRHYAPQFAERGHGKIVAVTSAAPLRGL